VGASSWFNQVLTAISFLIPLDRVFAAGDVSLASSPSYQNLGPCPEPYNVSGANPGNWSSYPEFQQIRKCLETMFYDFSLYDEVDDASGSHHINACSSFGPDFTALTNSKTASTTTAQSVNVDFEIGWWNEGLGLAADSLRSLIAQMREYTDNGHGATNRSLIMFGQSGQATVGLFIGQGLLNQGLGASVMKLFEDKLDHLNVSTPSLAMQLYSHLQAQKKHNSHHRTHARADCTTVQVDSGDSCGKLATKCGITPAEFTRINSDSSFCANLRPKLHVCCSSWTLPDFSPSQGSDGTCYTYQVRTDDNCDDLAAHFSLTKDKIEDFNNDTWGWNGCKVLFIGASMCLSKGNTAFPTPTANANCGPQKPDSKPPTDGSKIKDMKPYHLNACATFGANVASQRTFASTLTPVLQVPLNRAHMVAFPTAELMLSRDLAAVASRLATSKAMA
jgi:hypothetical protein